MKCMGVSPTGHDQAVEGKEVQINISKRPAPRFYQLIQYKHEERLSEDNPFPILLGNDVNATGFKDKRT